MLRTGSSFVAQCRTLLNPKQLSWCAALVLLVLVAAHSAAAQAAGEYAGTAATSSTGTSAMSGVGSAVGSAATKLDSALSGLGSASAPTTVSPSGGSSATPYVPSAADWANASSGYKGPATIEFTSAPSGAQVYVDGRFVGNTPLKVEVPAGQHSFQMRKANYRVWESKLKPTSAHVRVNAPLEPSVVILGAKQ
jgi:hypothetical protein